MSKEKLDLHLHECIRFCWECRDSCQDVLFNHILERGGDQLNVHAIRLLTDCMEICQTAADFMRRNSALHHVTCNACAAICEACAEACEAIGTEHPAITLCIEHCRRCAESCRAMSQMGIAA